MINVRVENCSYSFPKTIKLKDVIERVDPGNKDIIVAAIINNRIYELNDLLDENCEVKFLTIADVLGNRIYRRSLFLIMARAIYELFPDTILSIEHSLSNGIYCELRNNNSLNQPDVKELKAEMKKLVKKDLPINRMKLTRDKAIDIYKKQNFKDKVRFIRQSSKENFTVYELDGFYDYFYYHMVPSTGYLDKFDLHFRYPGFILLFPQRDEPRKAPQFKNQPKLANIFLEYERLGEILGVANVNELNKLITDNDYGEIIRIAEALHEKNIARIADRINDKIKQKRIILIAGPSSSGKTTFSHRLSTQLRINGLKPVAISVDDYFVNREDTPRDENGDLDFEALEAIDLDLFNDHLVGLLQGKRIEIPRFNFKKGIREYRNDYLQLEKDQPIIIEGIHGLNDELTRVIPQDHKFKIYISALTQLNIDRHNRIPTTDTRVIRRVVRDHYNRGHCARKTLEVWPSVRRGEERNIFPYQEDANIMFNSALIYELSVLKKYAVPLLNEIDSNQEVFYEAKRLLEILSCFKEMPDNHVPQNSILREFIGGSVFR